MKIRTEYDPKPIPRRDSDWTAVDDETYDGPGSPIGTGATEQEAIDDLLEQIECLQPMFDVILTSLIAWLMFGCAISLLALAYVIWLDRQPPKEDPYEHDPN